MSLLTRTVVDEVEYETGLPTRVGTYSTFGASPCMAIVENVGEEKRIRRWPRTVRWFGHESIARDQMTIRVIPRRTVGTGVELGNWEESRVG